MAWTAPMTAVANSAFTAAQFNTHIRDNLLETAPAKATTAGRIFVTDGVNSIVEREIASHTVATNQTTSSTSYTDLGTTGPTVTVSTGTKALALWRARLWNDTSGHSSLISVAVSGATTIAASDTIPLVVTATGVTGLAFGVAQWWMFTSLTAGSNTFTCKYRVTTGTGNFIDRSLLVIPL